MATFIDANYGVNNDATDIDTPISTPSNAFATIDAGDTIIVGVTWYGADDDPTVYDTGARTYNALTKVKHSTTNKWVQLFWYRYSSGASNQCVFIGNNATSTYKNIIAARFSGMGANPYSSQSSAESTSSTSVTLGSALAISGAGVTVAVVQSEVTQSSITPGPTGFALAGVTGSAYVGLSYEVVGGSDSNSVSFSGPTSTSWVMAAATFLDSGGGGATTKPAYYYAQL